MRLGAAALRKAATVEATAGLVAEFASAYAAIGTLARVYVLKGKVKTLIDTCRASMSRCVSSLSYAS